MRHLIVAIAGAFILASCGNADESNSAASEEPEVSVVTESAESSSAVEAASGEAIASPAAQSSEDLDGRDGTWGDIVYGDPNAPVVMIEYASLTCPACAYFSGAIFPQLKEKYIDTGKVRFVFRNFIRDRYDLAAATATRCDTAETSKQLVKLYFSRQKEWSRSQNPVDELASIARRAGISRAKFDRCLANREMHEHLVGMTKDGTDEYDVNATPTIIIDDKKVDNYAWENLDKILSDKF